MNFLILSEDIELDRHSGVIDILKGMGYNLTHCYKFEDRPDIFFDFFIVDELLINSFKDIHDIPFLVNIHSKSEHNTIYENGNCLGFIDLDSNPLSISSYLNIVLKNIKHYNVKHRSQSVKNHFSKFDLVFFKTLPNGLVFHDKNGKILDVNPAAEEILCATKDQLTGVTTLDTRWHSIKKDGTLLEGHEHPVMVAIKTKKCVSGYIMGISSGISNLKWINIDAIPILDESGDIELVYTNFRDITLEREEHKKIQLLSMAVKYSPVSVIITDKRGVIESINPKVTEVTGYSYESLIGHNPRILKSDNSTTDYKELWKTISSGRVWRGEFTNLKENGEEYIESAIISPVFNDHNEIINYVALQEDITGLKTITKKLEKTLLSMEDTVRERTKSLRSAQSLTLESLATLSEYRDNETGAHIKRTKLYVKFVLEKIRHKLDYTDDEIFQIWSSAPLHDIGKVAISDAILLKKGKLTEEEFMIMKGHPVYGNEALMRVSECKDDDTYLKFAKEITLFHHEKWDGSGYPYGLSGEDIPISGRLMALADVYDALRSTRPYKVGFSHERAVKMILEQDGKHFDPDLIKIFKEYHEDFDKIFIDSTEDIYNIDNIDNL